MLKKPQINQVLHRLKQKYNHTTTALRFNTSFQLLISTMLSAQSTDKRVNIVTKELFDNHPDAHSFLSLSQSDLEEKIKREKNKKTYI